MSGEATMEQSELLPEDRARADQYALLARLFYRGPDAALLAAIAASAIQERSASAIQERSASAIQERSASAIQERSASAIQERSASAIQERSASEIHDRSASAIQERPDSEIDDATGSAAGGVKQAWMELVSASSRADFIAVQQEYDRVFIGTGMAAVTPYASFYLGDTGREKILVRLRDDLASFGLARNETAAEPEDHFAGLFDVMRHLVLAGSDDASLARQQEFFARYIERAYPLFCDAAICCEATSFYSLVARFAKTFLFVDASAMLMV